MNPIATLTKLCRLCGTSNLSALMDLGKLSLTGVFLAPGENAPKAELVLAQCSNCHLVQLLHSYPPELLYGANYGYESHLNLNMVSHLQAKAKNLEKQYIRAEKQAVVVDIASNDGILLSGYQDKNIIKIGIDPLINILEDYYPADSIKILEYFSANVYWENFNKPADLVTSVSVIYDLEAPIKFANDVFQILSDGGIWHFEQSYLPTMVATTSYDTICHEHLLYFSLHDLRFLLNNSGFQLIDATLNSTNGGSIAITAKKSHLIEPVDPFVDFLLAREVKLGFQNGSAMEKFVHEALTHRDNIKDIIYNYKILDFNIFGLGASTKGNVLLQWAELNGNFINSIGDINPKKFGKLTPGSAIPIVPEEEILKMGNKKSIALVLPWHFRSGILDRAESFLSNGGKLLFPLPNIEVVGN